MRRFAATLALCLLPATSPARGAETLALYSNACWHREAGDLLGYRMGIIRLPDATYIFLQAAEGEWSAPWIAKASASELTRGKLVFSVSDGSKPINFRGVITEKMIAGRFDGLHGLKGEPLAVRLKKVSAADKAVPDCR